MSDMMPPDGDMPDDPFGGIPDDVRADADALLARWHEMEDKARLLGLYVEGEPQIVMTPTPMGPKIGIAVQFNIGRVAFSERVQNPEKNKVEDTARSMEVALKDDLFLDERERIRKGLAEGKTLDEIMLDGEEDDDGAPDTPHD